jgi:hypothetical protein
MRGRARLTGMTLASMILVLGIAGTELRAQGDPLMGVWRLNVEKSKAAGGYKTGTPPQAIVRTHTATPDGIRVESKTTAADGTQSHFEFTGKFDGKPFSVTGGGNRDQMSMTRPDRYNVQTSNWNQGKETTRTHWTISSDGKTFTNRTAGTFPNGQPANGVVVYDRMPDK